MKKKEASNDTRRYHWSALKGKDVAGSHSVWNANEEPLGVDLSNLKHLFANKPNPAASSAVDSAAESKDRLVTLINPKRANNIAIALSRFKAKNVAAAILACDTTDLDLEAWVFLSRCLPEEEEAKLVASYAGDPARLGRAESFFLNVRHIRRLRQRVTSMILVLQFPSQADELEGEVGLLRSACEDLSTSTRFPRLLRLVLDIGNFLNAGSNMGQAAGFRLDALPKLQDTRSTADAKVSLLDYLAQVVLTTVPDVAHFREDLAKCDQARRLNTDLMAAQAASMEKSVAALEEELALFQPSGEGDGFPDKVSASLAAMRERVTSLSEALRAARELFSTTVAFYGDDAKEATCESFFGILSTFSKAFKAAEEKHLAQNKKKASAAPPAKREPEQRAQTAN
jgi:diaphanous 1